MSSAEETQAATGSPWWVLLPALVIAAGLAFLYWRWEGRPIPLDAAPVTHIPCVSYAPYRSDQTPFDQTTMISLAAIEEDFTLLAGLTDCVRTYATEQGLDAVPEIAARHGLKVMLGAWIGRDPEKNAREIATAIRLANQYPDTVRVVVVGNEVLLRREQPPDRLAAMIEEVRKGVPPSVKVTYADVWEFWLRHAEVSKAVDFVTVHMLPYWEDDPIAIDGAIDHVREIWWQVSQAFPGKKVFIGEAGWPSTGRMREGALPSPVNQARFVREFLTMAAREGIEVNVIEAFDQPWKRALEGTVGGHWGLFTTDRQQKVTLSGDVSNDPMWQKAWAAGAILSFIPVLAVVTRRRRMSVWQWLALAGLANGAGIAWVEAARQFLVISLGTIDWVLAVVQWLGAVAMGSLAARRIFSPGSLQSLPSIASLFAAWPFRHDGQAKTTPATGTSRLDVALALLWALGLFGGAAITLALVFDPRYRDFPTAAYLVPAASGLLLAWRETWNADVGVTQTKAIREEDVLAAILAVGGIAIAVNEGLANYQALGWAGVSWLLSLPALWRHIGATQAPSSRPLTSP